MTLLYDRACFLTAESEMPNSSSMRMSRSCSYSWRKRVKLSTTSGWRITFSEKSSIEKLSCSWKYFIVSLSSSAWSAFDTSNSFERCFVTYFLHIASVLCVLW
jgi:hypothetical protein